MPFDRKICTFVLALVLSSYTTVAFAQVESATTTADPSRVEQQFLQSDTLPTITKDVTVESSSVLSAPPGSGEIKFTLQTVRIEGVNIYTSDDLSPFYKDKLGQMISLTELYEIANSLTNKYRNDGYILTQVIVPPQTIEGGNITLRAVEGFVDQIIIEGTNNETEIKQIRKYADNLRENNILSAKNLERYLLLINDLPGVKARSVLSPSQTLTGASDLTIIVERETFSGIASFDNHGSRFLGPNQALLSGSANSIFGVNERISGQIVVAGDKDRANELMFGSISYEQPIDRYGTKVRAIGSITSTEPGHDLDEFDVKGNSKFMSLSLIRPFIRSRTTNFSGRVTYDMRNVRSRNDIEPTRHDNIRSARIGTALQFMDDWIGVGVNAIDLEVSKGLDVFGASQKNAANLTRGRGDPKYVKAKLQIQRLQRITPKLNLLLFGEGQWAKTPLLSSEEFGVGGINVGRGYDSSEIVGDDGISGKVELQWNEPKEFNAITDYQLYAFLDGGRVWDQDATTSAGKKESIASTGLGLRADVTENTSANLAVAFPLTRQVDAENDKDPRYYINLTHRF